MFAALVTVEVHIPAATSLKAKRSVVRALVADLRNGLNVAVAEVGHQDLWQRCTLGVATVSETPGGALKVAQQVEKIVFREPRLEVIRIDVEVVSPE